MFDSLAQEVRECTFLLIISVDTFCRDGSEKEVYKEQTMHSNADVTDQFIGFVLLTIFGDFNSAD
jgi:hypothetical protein